MSARSRSSVRREELIVPILVAVYLVGYLVQVWRLPLSATLYPYLLASVIALGLLVVVAKHWRQSHAQTPRVVVASRVANPALAFTVLCALYPVAVTTIGFTFATATLVILLLRVFGERRWTRSAMIAAGVSLGFLASIDWLLGIPLPRFSFAVLPIGI